MKQLEKIDLNAICRILEWMAIITLVLGIIVSIFLGVQKVEYGYRDKTIINWSFIIIGITISFIDFVFLLFLSRVGDAIDDIRIKYVYSDIINDDGDKQ